MFTVVNLKEDSHSLKVIIITLKWVPTRALFGSHSVCFFFGTLAFALVRFFASAWRWRDYQRAVRRGAACIGCKLKTSVRCFPSLSGSHALPSVDSQTVLSVWRRQHKLAAPHSARSASMCWASTTADILAITAGSCCGLHCTLCFSTWFILLRLLLVHFDRPAAAFSRSKCTTRFSM